MSDRKGYLPDLGRKSGDGTGQAECSLWILIHSCLLLSQGKERAECLGLPHRREPGDPECLGFLV